MKVQKLDFESDPDDFPEVWNSGENPITVRIDIDEIINKHIYLALEDRLENADCLLSIGEDGKAKILVTLDGLYSISGIVDFETVVMDVKANDYQKPRIKRLAESLQRCAAHILSVAERTTL